MKTIFVTLSLLAVMNSKADIEYSADDAKGKATPAEITRNQSCFREVEDNGCGSPGEDIKHFRSCMKNALPNLSDDCQKMMSDLYGG